MEKRKCGEGTCGKIKGTHTRTHTHMHTMVKQKSLIVFLIDASSLSKQILETSLFFEILEVFTTPVPLL